MCLEENHPRESELLAGPAGPSHRSIVALERRIPMADQERTGVVTMRGNPLTLIGPALKPGDKAPDFQALAQDHLRPDRTGGRPGTKLRRSTERAAGRGGIANDEVMR